MPLLFLPAVPVAALRSVPSPALSSASAATASASASASAPATTTSRRRPRARPTAAPPRTTRRAPSLSALADAYVNLAESSGPKPKPKTKTKVHAKPRVTVSLCEPTTLPTSLPPLSVPVSPPPPERVRKPHGYWNRLSTVESELVVANRQLGLSSRKVVPRIEDLRAAGRGDLVAALMKHGGVKAVAAALRWTTSSSAASNASHSATSDRYLGDGEVPGSRRVRKVRNKLQRRPTDYWRDVGRVYNEMGAFIDEFGTRGVMPTRKQLYMFGRADLANAAMKHGGLRAVARGMGIQGRKPRRAPGYWREFSQVRDTIVTFSETHCPGVMPTADELSSKGLSCVVNAIANHGGFPKVAERCGLTARNVKRQGAPVMWDEARVRREYLGFIMRYYPRLALERTMVGERQLRLHGRNDLSYAINKFGGFARLGRMLGMRKRAFRRRDAAHDEGTSSDTASASG